jgi:hypothetical protein
MGQLLQDAIGEGATKKLAKRCVELMSGNISSYSRLMNNNEQLQKAKEMVDLTAVLGEMRAEKDEENKAKATERKAEEAERATKKVEAAQKESEKKSGLQAHLVVIVETLATRTKIIDSVNIGDLKDLLRYFFEPPLAGLSKMKRADLVAAVEEHLEVYRAGRFEA